MLAVNPDAYFFFAQAAIPHLLVTKGNIVNIASNSGLMGGAYTVLYCMTKGAVVQLTRALAMEFLKKQIRINAIAPGGTETALVAATTFPDDVDYDLVGRYMVRARWPSPMTSPSCSPSSPPTTAATSTAPSSPPTAVSPLADASGSSRSGPARHR